MTASSDRDTYGQLVSYFVDQPTLPPGPLRVADQAESEQAISPELSLQANEETGTRVLFGDLQLLPIADGLVYVRPVYVEASNKVTEYRFVIASYDNNAAMDTDLESALAKLFPGFEAEIGDRVPDTDGDDDGGVDPTPEEDDAIDDAANDSTGDDLAGDDVAGLVAEAERLYAEAQTFLVAGDLGAYQEAMDQVGILIGQISDALEEG
jgi:uncharacterized membrane protein (UPF0182 family)